MVEKLGGGRGEVTYYRQGWKDGALAGKPQVALKLPLAFPLEHKGNAFHFSRDLSTVVYARPGGQNLYFLTVAGIRRIPLQLAGYPVTSS